MTYNPLTIDTAQTPERRREEADRILKIISDAHVNGSLQPKELAFITDMQVGGPVSPKQVLWLRDLKAKYVE